MSDINRYRNLWMNFDLRTSPEYVKEILLSIEDYLSLIERKREVRITKFIIEEEQPPYKYVIIDLECNPPKFFGMLISNHLYQLFIIEERFLEPLYKAIAKVLEILIDFYIFTFATFEKRFFTKILPFKFKLDQNSSMFQTLKIVNIQLRDFEGLIPALYSVGEEVVDDPLLRDNKKIDLHFKQGHFGLILEHNKSCLLSTQKIVQKRFLKENMI